MNRKHRTSLRTALAGTLALAALAGGGLLNSSLAPQSSYTPATSFGVVADVSPNTSFGPTSSLHPATSFGAVADVSPDTSFGPRISFGPVADYSNDSSLHPAGSLSSL